MMPEKSPLYCCNNCRTTKEGDECDDCAGRGCQCPCQQKNHVEMNYSLSQKKVIPLKRRENCGMCGQSNWAEKRLSIALKALKDIKNLRGTMIPHSAGFEAGEIANKALDDIIFIRNLCVESVCPACGAQYHNRQDHKTCHDCINCGTQWPGVLTAEDVERIGKNADSSAVSRKPRERF